MLRLSGLSDRYKYLRAYHKYNYPALFFAASAVKTLAQIGLVAGIAWYGVSLATQPIAPHTNNQYVQETIDSPAQTTIATQVASTQPVEIPAVGSVVAPISSTKKPISVITAQTATNNEVLSSDWLLDQDPTAFTIQFGTSPDKDLLYRSAKSFDSETPVVVFPFKRTPSNRPVYGFASGIYASLDEARQGILELPESAITYGPWVRSIGKVQTQIKSMSQ